MGRTRTDGQDQDEEPLDFDDFDDEGDLSIDALLNEAEALLPKDKKTRKPAKKLSQESDDWHDPEDDIMFGFED